MERGGDSRELVAFCEKENLYLFNIKEAIIISTLKPQVDKNGFTYIFSGVTRWQDKFIFGAKDIERNDITVAELREGIGEFELLLFKDQRLELSTMS